MKLKGNCWPTPEQLLLLQAGLLPEPRAHEAWRAYCDSVVLDNIDDASFQLLPQVYRNLKPCACHIKAFQLSKGVYRYHWATNQLHFQSLKTVLTCFQQLNISACLLTGAALILGCYHDKGVRVIRGVDMMVPTTQAWLAMQTLRAQHWQPVLDDCVVLTPDFIASHQTLVFRKVSHEQLSLTWHFLPDAITDSAAVSLILKKQLFCESSIGLTVETLSAEDQLLHILLHGIRHSPHALIQWVVDAVVLLRMTLKFDWEYFLSQVKKVHGEWLVFRALRYLHQQGFIAVPECIEQRCAAYRPKPFEQLRLNFLTKTHFRAFLPIQIVWHRHLRNTKPSGYISALRTFPSYLMRQWGTDSLLSFGLLAIKKWSSHLWYECKK